MQYLHKAYWFTQHYLCNNTCYLCTIEGAVQVPAIALPLHLRRTASYCSKYLASRQAPRTHLLNATPKLNVSFHVSGLLTLWGTQWNPTLIRMVRQYKYCIQMYLLKHNTKTTVYFTNNYRGNNIPHYQHKQSPSWEANSHSAGLQRPRFYGNRKFNTVLTRARHWSQSWPMRI